MSLNPIDYVFLFGDYFVSISLLAYFIRAYQKKIFRPILSMHFSLDVLLAPPGN